MDRMVVETLAIAPQAYLPRLGSINLLSRVYILARFFVYRQMIVFWCLHLILLISKFLANSFCPPYSLRWNGRITLHNQGKVINGSSRLVVGIPQSSYCKCLAWMTLAADTTGNRIARSHPGLMGGCQTFFIPLSLLWSRSPSLFLVTIWLGALTFLPCSSPPLNLSLSRCVGSRLLSHSLFALWMGAQFPSLIFCSLNNKLTTNSSANQSNPTATHFSTFPLLGSSSSSHPLLPTLSSPS